MRKSGALSVSVKDPRPLILLYHIRRLLGFFLERPSPNWAVWDVWEKGLGRWRLRLFVVVGVGWLGWKTGNVDGCVGGVGSELGKEEVGGGTSPWSVRGRRNKVARAVICLWGHWVR